MSHRNDEMVVIIPSNVRGITFKQSCLAIVYVHREQNHAILQLLVACYWPGPTYIAALTGCCQQSSCGGFVRVIALLSAGISRVLSSGWLTVAWSLVLEQVDDLFTWHPICSLFLIMTCSIDHWQLAVLSYWKYYSKYYKCVIRVIFMLFGMQPPMQLSTKIYQRN